jgi:hypothetical protein
MSTQKEIASKKKTVNEIDIQAIQEVATDIGTLVKYTSNIRGKTAKIQNLTEKYKLEIDEDLEEIKTAVGNYQKKLMDAVAGKREETIPVTQKVKSVSISWENHIPSTLMRSAQELRTTHNSSSISFLFLSN